MAMTRNYRSRASEAIHSSAAMLYKAGALDEATMRELDARHLGLGVVELAEIKPLHKR